MKIVVIITSLSLLAMLAAAAVLITTPTAQAQAQQQQQQLQPLPITRTTPTTTDSNGNVSILSSSQYSTEFGSTYIVGEVRNDLSDVVQFVQIVGRFYDSNGLLIDTDFTYTDLDLLRPGEKSPFRLIISDESVAQRIDNYTLAVNWDPVFADPSAVAAAGYNYNKKSLGRDSSPRPLPHWSAGVMSSFPCASDTQALLAPYQGNALPGFLLLLQQQQ